MEMKDLSAEIVNNILRVIYEFDGEIKFTGVALGAVYDFDMSSLTNEERKKKISESMGIVIQAQEYLTDEQKKKILQKINDKIFKFEVRSIS